MRRSRRVASAPVPPPIASSRNLPASPLPIRASTPNQGPGGVTLRPHTDLSADDVAAVVEIVPVSIVPVSIVPVSKDGKARIKLHDKRPALDTLARHLGLFGARRSGTDIRTQAQNRARAALNEKSSRSGRRKRRKRRRRIKRGRRRRSRKVNERAERPG